MYGLCDGEGVGRRGAAVNDFPAVVISDTCEVCETDGKPIILPVGTCKAVFEALDCPNIVQIL